LRGAAHLFDFSLLTIASRFKALQAHAGAL
jgi:hypothetical protein